MWYLPFTKSPRKHTVTYHFSDLQEVYSDNPQIHTKCQLQYFHPPHISTSGKCHCNNSSDNKSYWIHRVDVKVSAQFTTVTYMHQSQPALHSLRKHLTVHLELWPGNHLIWCNTTELYLAPSVQGMQSYLSGVCAKLICGSASTRLLLISKVHILWLTQILTNTKEPVFNDNSSFSKIYNKSK